MESQESLTRDRTSVVLMQLATHVVASYDSVRGTYTSEEYPCKVSRYTYNCREGVPVTPLKLPTLKMGGTRCNFCIRIALIGLCTLLVGARAQPGFLSIDCGSTVNYTDSVTGIQWTTDERYIQTGWNSAEVTKRSTSLDNLTQVWDYRSFDKRKKNCYNLPVQNSTIYLVRGTFKFIDAALLVKDLSFQLFLDSTPWVRVTYSSSVAVGGLDLDEPRVFEAIIKSIGPELFVCLVRDQGRPFISALELRKLDEGMYLKSHTDLDNQKILVLGHRINLGMSPGPPIRYPVDPYDRIWRQYEGTCPSTIRSSKPVTRQPDLYTNDSRYQFLYGRDTWESNRVPPEVMEDACVGQNSSLLFRLTFPATVQKFYGVVYFQEVDDNATELNIRGIELEIRSLNETVFWNVSRIADEVAGAFESLSDFVFTVTFRKMPWSRLEPLANALEFYLWNDTSNSTTDFSDAMALKQLKAGFNLSDSPGDPCYPVSWDWLVCDYGSVPSRVTKVILSDSGVEGFLDPAIGSLTELTDLLLDNNHLTGEIPDLRMMSKLQRVHLENNSFSGAFPDYLLRTPSLLELNVASNSLSGVISSCPRATVQLSCGDNPLLQCASKLRDCGGSNKGTQVAKIAGGVVAGFVFLSTIVVALVCMRRRTHAKVKSRKISVSTAANQVTQTNHTLSGDQKNSSAYFTPDQVAKMTYNYRQKIGEGSFGAVYLGELPSGRKVAVKVHNASSRQGIDEFLNEVNLLSRVHHRNLVSLLGYCEEQDQQILIYEYLGNGTLREHLYGHLLGTSPLGWKTRLDIAIDSAKGLEYLHKDCHPQIIHRDVKSSNILLDEKLVAKVADFGLSKAGPDEGFNSGVSTVVKGTPGYFDPEYFMTQRVTHKSDVYSYGIVLLELLSGLRPFNSQLPDGSSGTLIEWVQKQYPTNIMAIVDKKLEGQYTDEIMKKVTELAVSCIALQSVHRPDMEHVVWGLCEARDAEFPGELGPSPSEAVESYFSHTPSSSNTTFTDTSFPSTLGDTSFPSTLGDTVSSIPTRQSEVDHPTGSSVHEEASSQMGR